MNKKTMSINKADAALHDMISAGLSQQADTIDARIQARLRRARVKAVSLEQEQSWLARFWQAISVPAVMRMPIAQASVAMLVAVFSISLVLTPAVPVGSNAADINISDMKFQPNEAQSLSEMDVLMSNEDMEFLENLEIYEWLAAEYG